MSPAFVIVIVVFVTLTTTTTSTTATNRQGVDTETILYLQKYGYLCNNGNNTQLSFEEGEIKQAISLFQEYYQIPGDGTLNNYRLYQMRKPQCGLPDILHHEHNTGRKKWAKIHLTWNFYLADVHTLKTTAFAFSRKRNEEICSSSFDGPGGVLANAFYPSNRSIVNTNRGQTYAIFNSNDMAQIDECSMSIRSYQLLQSIFPGIPSAPTLAFRYINGNLYFAKKQQFYTFNEFTRIVTEAGKFNLNILNVECSRDGLLQQMQEILGQLIRSSNTH
ncbi:MMP1 collagenase, partial [Acromyrmex insinuator]